MANPPPSPGTGERGPLLHEHITSAVVSSTDAGQTLDFSHKNITEIPEDATHELATVGREEDDDEGCVTRIALVFNFLNALPASFALISRLRYLNLRSNQFNVFPEVLCNMPSLEILDISRNKLKRLPARAGTLKNLRVFSFTKNKIDRLPGYFSEFIRLRMLKIEHNPIEWPPNQVLKRTQDGDEGMELWIQDLLEWIRRNTEETQYQSAAQPLNSVGSRKAQNDAILPPGDEHVRSASRTENETSSVTHSRAPSDESVSSTRHFAQPAPLADFLSDAPPYQEPPQQFGGFGGSTPASQSNDDYMNSHRDESLLAGGTVHGRNASTSFMGGRSLSASSGLFAKKSLPDLRSAHLNGSFPRSQQRKVTETRKNLEEPAVPSLSSSHQLRHEAQGQQSRPSTSNRPVASSTANGQVPIEAQRHSYFKRYSTLPLSSVSKTIPESMLKTVDAIRGIFFAVGQMHSAIQHYTVFGTDERQSSGVLGRLMNGASDYMLKLMGALDRFDSLSRRGLPPPSVCRELIEACRDNVAISVKVVGVLNAQLKVLAGTDDLRFARTSLLMLYGAMAEVSNSWNALAPRLEAIQPLLHEYRPPPAARSNGASSSITGRSNITPIAESPTSPPRTVRSPHVPSPSIPGKSTTRAISRRNGGSFSYKDVQIGRSLATSSPMLGNESPVLSSAGSSSSTSTVVNGTSGGLKSALRNPFAPASSPSSSPSAAIPNLAQSSSNSLVSHSREGSVNSGLANNAARATPVLPVIRNLQPLARSRTSDLPGSAQLVDRDLLATMDAACDTAFVTWSTIEEEPFQDKAAHEHLKEVVEKARIISTTLKRDIESIRAGYLESERKSLWENASMFAKIIAQVAMLLKPHTAHISSNLRSQVEKLITSTKEYTILLSVSSFVPVASPRPFSPAFGGLQVDQNRALANAGLGRSRSATATQETASRPFPGQHKDVPWSAMPHQSFKVPSLPPSSLGSQRFDEDDEKPQRRI